MKYGLVSVASDIAAFFRQIHLKPETDKTDVVFCPAVGRM